MKLKINEIEEELILNEEEIKEISIYYSYKVKKYIALLFYKNNKFKKVELNTKKQFQIIEEEPQTNEEIKTTEDFKKIYFSKNYENGAFYYYLKDDVFNYWNIDQTNPKEIKIYNKNFKKQIINTYQESQKEEREKIKKLIGEFQEENEKLKEYFVIGENACFVYQNIKYCFGWHKDIINNREQLIKLIKELENLHCHSFYITYGHLD